MFSGRRSILSGIAMKYAAFPSSLGITLGLLTALGSLSTLCAQDYIVWEKDINTALAKAKATERLVFIHFHGDDCAPCKLMESEVFPNRQVIADMNRFFVPVRVNTSLNPQLRKQFDVSAIPTDVILKSDGQFVHRRQGGISAERFAVYLNYINEEAGAKPSVVVQEMTLPVPALENRTVVPPPPAQSVPQNPWDVTAVPTPIDSRAVGLVPPQPPPMLAPSPPSTPLPPSPPPPAPDGKQRIAVYMAGEEPIGVVGAHKALGGELARTISKSDQYTAIDRTDAIREQLDREHIYQRSGAVSDEQIKNLGVQFSADFLCIADINTLGGNSYYLNVRLINVETAELIRSATLKSSLKNANVMVRAAQKLARELIEPEKVAREKRIVFNTGLAFGAAGAGAFAYGLYENSNVKKHIDAGEYAEASGPIGRRDISYIVGSVFLLSGVSIVFFF